MTKQMRMTPDGQFIYPWPIVKNQKYLISSPGVRSSKYLILLIEMGYLDSPPNFDHTLHSDGTTKVYQVPGTGPIPAFLPHREQDPAAAAVIEKVLAKAFWNYVKTDSPKRELGDKVKKRFEAQLACSSCQGLGIDNETISKLVLAVLSI